MENTKIAELFYIGRNGDIRMSRAILDLARLAKLWGMLMIIAFAALACYFVFEGHIPLFITFLAILVASISLTGWGCFVLPDVAEELLEDPEEIAAAMRRDSWKLPD